MNCEIKRMTQRFQFFIENWKVLVFGWVFLCLATLGSGYFIGIFNASFGAEFKLNHEQIGLLFALVTVTGSIPLLAFGKIFDHANLRIYSVITCVALAVGCFLIGIASNVWALGIGLLVVRVSGDWLMQHAALSSMAKRFGSNRGRAMSFSAVGYVVGAALLPIFAVSAVPLMGWRWVWAIMSGGVLVVAAPLVLWLLKDIGAMAINAEASKPSRIRNKESTAPWTRIDVIKDPLFFLILPLAMALPFMSIAFFVHQVHFAEMKGWSLAIIGSSFSLFAISKAAASIAAGAVIDRFGARRLFLLHTIPMMIGFASIALSSNPIVVPIYMIAIGITSGMWSIVMASLWAELYGTERLGAIQSMAQTIFIISTSISAYAIGWLVDQGLTIETLAEASIVYLVMAIMVNAFGLKRGILS